jgi:hypothetical protein
MADEDYEIVSHKEINRLKQEIAKLKEAEFSGSANEIMVKLDKILEIFKEASLSMQNGSEDKQHNELNEKLDTLSDQNQRIAEGVLAVADLVNKAPEKPEIPKQAPAPLGQASTFPPHMPPPGMMPPGPNPMSPNPMSLRPGPMPHPEQRPSLNAPQFPKPGIPALNPLEQPPERPTMGGLPPLPPKPHKKGLFR